MPRGGRRPGAGRKPGAATKKSREIANVAAANGIMPLEVMLNAMRAQWLVAAPDGVTVKDAEAALVAAKLAGDAAPYIHPRLSSIEQKVDAEVRQRVVSAEPLNDEEWADRYGFGAGNRLAAANGTAKSSN
jgi:hypothetical protein